MLCVCVITDTTVDILNLFRDDYPPGPTSPTPLHRDNIYQQQTMELQKRQLEFMQQCEERRIAWSEQAESQRLKNDHEIKRQLTDQGDGMLKLEERR
jgi:hypothetical protein